MWGLLQKVESNFSTNLLLDFVFFIYLVTVFVMLEEFWILKMESRGSKHQVRVGYGPARFGLF